MHLLHIVRILAGAAALHTGQSLFSVTLSRSVYLSMPIRRFSPLQTAARRSVQPVGARDIFPSTGVTNMSPHYNLSPRCEYIRLTSAMRSNSTSQTKQLTCNFSSLPAIEKLWCDPPRLKAGRPLPPLSTPELQHYNLQIY